MARIYVVTHRETDVDRFVRANTLNAAIRAVADETFTAKAASTEDMFLAFKQGFEVLDAVAPVQVDIDDPEEPDGK